LSVLAVNTQVPRAIIRKPHVALWPKSLDNPALNNAIVSTLAYAIRNTVWAIDYANRCFVAKKNNTLTYFLLAIHISGYIGYTYWRYYQIG